MESPGRRGDRTCSALRVLGVRIAWHVKRPTSSAVKRKAAARAGIGMRAPGSEQGRRGARVANSVDVVPTSTDPMGILKSTREFKAPGAVKEHTSGVRGGGRDPGVRRPSEERSTSRGYPSQRMHSKGIYLGLQGTRILVGFWWVSAASEHARG